MRTSKFLNMLQGNGPSSSITRQASELRTRVTAATTNCATSAVYPDALTNGHSPDRPYYWPAQKQTDSGTRMNVSPTIERIAADSKSKRKFGSNSVNHQTIRLIPNSRPLLQHVVLKRAGRVVISTIVPPFHVDRVPPYELRW